MREVSIPDAQEISRDPRDVPGAKPEGHPREGLHEALPREGLMMNIMAVHQQNSGIIGKSTPSALEISLDPRGSPSGHLSGLGISLGQRGWIS